MDESVRQSGAADTDDRSAAPPPTTAGQAEGEPGAPAQERSFWAELPVLVLVAFVLAVVLKTFLVQAFYIPSSSMEPTLHIGDRVLVNKVVYDLREPRRGEIVVFSEDNGDARGGEGPVRRVVDWFASGLGLTPPGERDFIKRIVGLPGETIAMRGGVVFIDGRPVPEATAGEGGYLSARDLNDFQEHNIPPGHYFMLGDNRPNSADSRFSLGAIAEEEIVGRAFVVIWPLSRAELLTGAYYPPAVAGRPAPAPSASG
ncbi:MAG TPA: signal peptidase I [Egibacteraceae bacterium]|nr:signal peptidase I [Actinomycetota bacterium]HWB72771.1 signal peptidase I [Egibacteraceae bacterium]